MNTIAPGVAEGLTGSKRWRNPAETTGGLDAEIVKWENTIGIYKNIMAAGVMASLRCIEISESHEYTIEIGVRQISIVSLWIYGYSPFIIAQ
jgi:hypothetical protein